MSMPDRVRSALVGRPKSPVVVISSDWLPWEWVEVSGRMEPCGDERVQARGSCISDSTCEGAAGGPAAGAGEA